MGKSSEEILSDIRRYTEFCQGLHKDLYPFSLRLRLERHFLLNFCWRYLPGFRQILEWHVDILVSQQEGIIKLLDQKRTAFQESDEKLNQYPPYSGN